MSEDMAGLVVAYYVASIVVMCFLLLGLDSRHPLVRKYGNYRGYTLAVLDCLMVSILWIPFGLFYWIRGLIRGE